MTDPNDTKLRERAVKTKEPNDWIGELRKHDLIHGVPQSEEAYRHCEIGYLKGAESVQAELDEAIEVIKYVENYTNDPTVSDKAHEFLTRSNSKAVKR